MNSRVKSYLSQAKWSFLKWYEPACIGPVRSRFGALSRRMRYPNPLRVPYREASLEACRDIALGDVLMCTPALRRAKQLNPKCRISFYTRYPTLLAGLPFIDHVAHWDDRPKDAIFFGYEDTIPPKRHIAKVMGDCIGVRVDDVRPECALDRQIVGRIEEELSGFPRPWIVINRFAGPHTPNKDWPKANWAKLARELARSSTVIEIGTTDEASNASVAGNYVNLAQRTKLAELVAVIAAADVHVGPISGPVHIAAAVGTPSVVIYGGYEHPVCSEYSGNINLYSPVKCSPCWLRDPCPYFLSCLHSIAVEKVQSSIATLCARRQPLVKGVCGSPA